MGTPTENVSREELEKRTARMYRDQLALSKAERENQELREKLSQLREGIVVQVASNTMAIGKIQRKLGMPPVTYFDHDSKKERP